MEHLYLEEGELFENEKATPCNPENSVEMEENNQSGYCLSELKAPVQNINSKVPLMLDVKHENTSERFHQDSCPCGNELIFPSYTSFVSHTNSCSRHSIGSSGRISDISNFYRAASLFNIPVNLKSSGFSCKRQKSQRRRSINNMGDFIYECSSTPATGDVIISPSARWIFDSIEGNVKTRSLLESSLLLHLDVLDDKMSQDRSRLANTKFTKSSELTIAPMLQKISRDERSELNLSERKLVSCTSRTSTCPYQTAAAAGFSISKGLLYCVWKSGLPYFVFSSEDGGCEVYAASPLKVKSSVNKAVDYVYVFRSRTNSKKGSKRHCKNTSSIVGRMKVSSSLLLSSNRTSLMETEFVLFGCHEDHSKEIQGSSSTLTKSKGLSKKVSEIFRSSHNLKHHSIHEAKDAFMCETVIGDLGDLTEMNLEHQFEQDFPPNLELAAIIVKDYEHNSNKKTAVGGWGLKFLDKGQVVDSATSEETTHSGKICEGTCNCESSTRRMDVIVPAGFHGGPIQIEGGPSRLTDRWRSDGHCDCGGWDLGCPLTVLKSNSNCSKRSPEDFNLFEEGKEELGEPALRMVNKSEGMHLIYFQSTLSALQSFAIAVAVIHSRSPELSPKM